MVGFSTTAKGSSGSQSTTMMMSPPVKAIPSSLPDSAQQLYLPISTSPSAATSTLPSLPYTSTSLSDAATSQGTYASNCVSSTFSAASCNEALLPSHGSSSNLYSFGSENSYKRTSHGDAASPTSGEGTLVSGQQYTRLRQPQPQYTSSFGALRRRSSTESRAHSTLRSSIGSYRA